MAEVLEKVKTVSLGYQFRTSGAVRLAVEVVQAAVGQAVALTARQRRSVGQRVMAATQAQTARALLEVRCRACHGQIPALIAR